MTWSLVGGNSPGSPATSGNLTLPLPAGITTGDLLVAVIGYRGSAAFSVPSGWNLLAQQSTGNTDNNLTTSIASGMVAYTIHTGTTPTNTFTRTGGDVAFGSMVAYRSSVAGTITAGPVSDVTLSTAASSSAVCPGITTTAANMLLVGFGGMARPGGITNARCATDPSTGSGTNAGQTGAPSTTWQERNDEGWTTGAGMGHGIFDALKSSAGSTGNFLLDFGLSARHYMAIVSFAEPSAATNVDVTSTAATATASGGSVTVDTAGPSVADVTGLEVFGNVGSVTVGQAVDVTQATVTGLSASVSPGFAYPRYGTSSRFLPSQWASLTGGLPRFGCLYIGRTWHCAAGDDIGTTASRPYAITSADNNAIRFEVRSGDVLEYSGIGYSDPTTSERCEMGGDSGSSDGQLAFNTDIHFETEMFFPSGFNYDAPWSAIYQFHATVGGSPIVDLGFRNAFGANRLILGRRTNTASSPVETFADVLGTAVPRDRWVPIVLRFRANTSGAGYIRLWIDGVQVYNFSGTVGYNGQTFTYCRFGIYRRATATTWIVYHRNMRLITGTPVNDEGIWIPPSVGGETAMGTVTVISGGSTIVVPVSVSVTGVAGTGEVGNVTALEDITPTTVEIVEGATEFSGLTSVGTVTVNESVSVSVIIVADAFAEGEVGLLDEPGVIRNVDAILTGVSMATFVGDVVVSFAQDVNVDVTGVEAFARTNKVLVWDSSPLPTSSSWVEIIP